VFFVLRDVTVSAFLGTDAIQQQGLSCHKLYSLMTLSTRYLGVCPHQLFLGFPIVIKLLDMKLHLAVTVTTITRRPAQLKLALVLAIFMTTLTSAIQTAKHNQSFGVFLMAGSTCRAGVHILEWKPGRIMLEVYRCKRFGRMATLTRTRRMQRIFCDRELSLVNVLVAAGTAFVFVAKPLFRPSVFGVTTIAGNAPVRAI